MKLSKSSILRSVAGLFMAGAVLTGCTEYATNEELAQLDSKNAEIRKLRQEQTDCSNKNATLNAELNTQNGVVNKLADEKAFVEKQLASFNPDAFAPKPVAPAKKK